ncbi:alpha/beta hydrolase fold domain-containing protein [Mycobacterium sp. IDR2000157661]|uniref:alpha/beta hydrolase fold domain-containing protein n=1 Tax=Mycobacterium sp. IDR2000157661 TaxID=2867005 RepID=UPI001EEC9969|nr:alpha/beta hydrolase fold domain-containing protein [Mycobacterium sp. IDR2000157661]ULE31819.1 alpha/beta hydrolase [Mycobacterium sp. IDR2000157661]
MAQRILPLVGAPRSFHLAGRRVAPPECVEVPTRHGDVRCLIYRPYPDAPLARGGDRSPVDLHLHGGAFIVRHPRQEEYVAEYVASEVGAVVVLADYATAPQAQYPVAEQQCFDVARWIRAEAPERGWDAARMSVSGASAGAKLAVNVCQQAHRSGEIGLRAAALAFPVVDLSRADRTSVKRRPRISRRVQRLAIDAYVVDPGVRCQPLASPVFDPDLAEAMPPTLIITGELDTLGPEGEHLAHELAGRGVMVTHHRLASTDHGFTRSEAATAHAALRLIGAHLVRFLT